MVASESAHTCVTVKNLLFSDHTISLIALGLVIILSFMERRRSFRRDVCNGRPGPVIPINFTNGDQHVLAHAAAFGCTAASIIVTFLLSVFEEVNTGMNRWLKTFVIYVKMMELGLQYYPIFACVEYGTRNIIAPIIGLVYALVILCLNLSLVFACESPAYHAFLLLPVVCCLLFICIKLGRNICDILARWLSDHSMKKELSNFKPVGRCHRYVRMLLSPVTYTTDAKTEESRRGILGLLSEHRSCLQTELIHRCSNRLVAIFVVSMVLLYQWFVLCVYVGHQYSILRDMVKEGLIFPALTDSGYRNGLLTFLEVFVGSFFTSTILATAIMILNMWKLYQSHRKHMKRLLTGNRAFIPDKCWNLSPSTIVARNLIYPGQQVGHLLWGFLLNLLVILITCFLLSYLLILPLAGKVPGVLLTPSLGLLPPLVMALIFRVGLFLFAGVFLQRESIQKGWTITSRRILALTNWRAYQITSYFIFFFYIFIGIFSCLRRIIISMVVGFYYLARLDKCTLIPGLERFDEGYKSYVSFLRMELSHCNPIVITFCDMMLVGWEQWDVGKLQFCYDGETPTRPVFNKARRRWYKLYTLIRNPQLVVNTKSSLRQRDNGSLECVTEKEESQFGEETDLNV